jgi:IclR family acetate operon transcriptional repressor
MRTHIVMRDKTTSSTLDQALSPGTSSGDKARNSYVIASALRTLEVLDAFAIPPHTMGLADVVAKLQLERNQAYRSLMTLEAAGYLVQRADARFELGSAASALATAAIRHHSASLMDVAAGHLYRLSEETRETVHLFVREGDQAVCVDRRESTKSVRLMSVLGRSIPLHAGAVPKAILAFIPGREREEVLARIGSLPQYTDRTVLDSDGLAAQLEEIRERTITTLERLPADVRAVENPAEYPVDASDGLTRTAERVQSELRREMGL